MTYSVTGNYDLWKLCIENNWFNAGTNEQYKKLFQLNEAGNVPLNTIATVIWTCTDTNDSAEQIEAVLEAEHTRWYELIGA